LIGGWYLQNFVKKHQMKKIIPFIFSIALFQGPVMAQIPNFSFENWGTPDPVGWQTTNNNTGNVINVTQNASAHDGSSAMKMEIWTYMGLNIASVAGSTEVGDYFPFNGHPNFLNGWYMGNFMGGDKVMVSTDLKITDTTSGAGMINISSNTAVYQAFSVPIIWEDAANADSAVITFLLSGSNPAFGTLGSYVIIDELTYSSSSTGIDEDQSQTGIRQVYPNPAKELINFQYQVTDPSFVQVSVTDLTGRVVYNCFSGEQGIGVYKIYIPTGQLSKGIYNIILGTKNGSFSEKVVIE
jgi:hypothetical protein